MNEKLKEKEKARIPLALNYINSSGFMETTDKRDLFIIYTEANDKLRMAKERYWHFQLNNCVPSPAYEKQQKVKKK